MERAAVKLTQTLTGTAHPPRESTCVSCGKHDGVSLTTTARGDFDLCPVCAVEEVENLVQCFHCESWLNDMDSREDHDGYLLCVPCHRAWDTNADDDERRPVGLVIEFYRPL